MIFPKGFYVKGVSGENNCNLAFIYAPEGMTTAGVFTVNKCAAHPVNYSKTALKYESHKLILINKGVANAATGPEGYRRLENLLCEVSRILDIGVCEMLAASTGVIGQQLDIKSSQIKTLLDSPFEVDPDSFSRAIMTTDTKPKRASKSFSLSGRDINITGFAKGSGMIAPNMATMLSFIVTDANINKETLQLALRESVDISFNRLNIDGEMSTNDTVFLVSSGKAENKEFEIGSAEYDVFCSHLRSICLDLVEQLAADGEGATKFIELSVQEAISDEQARKACQAIAVSPLCKTAFYGNSPNWGRIISVLGAAGIDLVFNNFSIDINSVHWIIKGQPIADLSEVIVQLKKDRFKLDIFLGSGEAKSSSYTCDYSPEYININAGYLS